MTRRAAIASLLCALLGASVPGQALASCGTTQVPGWQGEPHEVVEVVSNDSSGIDGMRDWTAGTVLLVFARGTGSTLYSNHCAGNTDKLSATAGLGAPAHRFGKPAEAAPDGAE